MNLESSDYNQVFNTFLNYYKEQVSAIDNKQGFNFNVLTEQCGSIVENSHTNLLMRLLEYKNKYGYVFLEEVYRKYAEPIIKNIIPKIK